MDGIRACVESIRKAAAKCPDAGYEILAVLQDAGSQNDEAVRREGDLLTLRTAQRPGLGAARNMAIDAAGGDYLVFLDDDATVADTIMSVLSAAISAQPAAAYCGRILDPASQRCYSICFEDHARKALARRQFRYFMGSAHVIRKTAIESAGRYDPRFGAGAEYGGAEESDLFFRLLTRNKMIVYEPALVFYHPLQTDIPADKVYRYARAVSAMLKKQMIIDSRHSAVYAMMLISIAMKSLLRVIQGLIVPARFCEKNRRFRFSSVLKGTLNGFLTYRNVIS